MVVESNSTDLFFIESALRNVARHVELVAVESYDELIPTLARYRSLPTIAVFDWHAEGSVVTAMEKLGQLGFAGRIPIIGTARTNPIEALDEACRHGVPRFVCKLPDEFTFKKKMAGAISDYVPGAKKVLPPAEVMNA
jgi:hypothetical protein